MKKSFIVSCLNDKIAEQKATIKEMRKNEGDKWSKNTVTTQCSQRRREISILSMMVDLVNQINKDEIKLDNEFFESLTCPAEMKGKIVVNEGDSVMDLMFNKYKDVKDISTKIQKACEKQGLVIDTKTGTIVRI